MTDSEIERLGKVLKGYIEEEREITKEIHIKHHTFIEHLLEQQDTNYKSYFKIRDSVLGWLVIVALLGAGHAVWDYVIHAMPVK